MSKIDKGDLVIYDVDKQVYEFMNKVGLDWASIKDLNTGNLELVSYHLLTKKEKDPWKIDIPDDFWAEDDWDRIPEIPDTNYCLCSNPDPKKSTMLFGEVFFVCECCKKELKP